MKKQIFKSILVGFYILISTAFASAKPLNAETIESSIVKLTDQLYIGQCEVSNSLYRSFLSDLKAKDKTEELNIARVDSLGWKANEPKVEEFVKTYHKDKQYAEMPVVNISYEAAVLFCKWLTQTYNAFPEKKYSNVTFSLPSEKEWLMGAKNTAGDAVFSTGTELRKDHRLPLANYRRTDIPSYADGNSFMTDIMAPVKSYWPNEKGTYNMSGNAAEMLIEKGVTKGGSFMDTEEGLKLSATGTYTHSTSKIGFRFVMHVENTKK